MAGTPAPNFRLPRLDGSKLSLEDFRGQRVLLVFSDPHCGPCNVLASELEKFHREDPGIQLVMVSRGEPNESLAKVKEHSLSFPVLLQQRWEISRLYAMFATPMAYLIDEQGIIAQEVAVGVQPILRLMAEATKAA
jgi:peroxiredoxin